MDSTNKKDDIEARQNRNSPGKRIQVSDKIYAKSSAIEEDFINIKKSSFTE